MRESRRRSLAATAGALVIGAGLTAGVVAGDRGTGGSVQAAAPAHGPASAERTASAQARRTGRLVEVVAERAESRDVFARPDGHFTARFYPGAVRVRHGSGWVPVDTTLARGSGGMVAPRATVTPMTFSGGGAGPLLTLRRGDERLTLDAPWPLPRPALTGATATYRGVLPGVDLRLTAEAEGFSEVLVVRDRKAAVDPRLAAIRFGLHLTGLAVRVAADGGMTVADQAGATVFASPPPAMWDAASHRSVSKLEATQGALILRPDRHLLADPATVFPVSI